MPWQRVPKKEAYIWNEKLKTTNAAFTQYPYYVSSEYNSVFSQAFFIKYINSETETAFAAIIEIGWFPFKVGVIDYGPVLLDNTADAQRMFSELKDFARRNSYMHLQIRPPFESPFNSLVDADADFEKKIYFPFHLKVEYDLNIYNKPEKELLAGFKLQGRRKIVLAGRVNYEFKKVDTDEALDDVRKLFKNVSKTKGYVFLPFKIYEAIYKEGKKYNLSDFYTAHLNGELVNVVLIVKDAQSYYHYTSALLVHGFKPSESPPAKLHFHVMRDCFYNEHKAYYNISFGGSDNLIRFKELFNPVEVEKPAYYTYVIKKGALNFLSKFTRKHATYLRSIFKAFENLFS